MNALRKLARTVAKNQMKKKGMVQICHHYGRNEGTKGNSYFSNHWKQHVRYR